MMMDELDLLKKDWQNKEEHLPKLSFNEIYKMIWKKSSSIVKWIFYISIAEFIFWIAIQFIPLKSEELFGEGPQFMQTVENGLDLIFFVVMFYFMFQFYQNYKRITAIDSSKELMKKILKTRKTVMRYVWFNLGLFALAMVIVFTEVLVFNPPENIIAQINNADSSAVSWFILILLFIGTILFIGLILWLFYKLLYGILLKRLKVNYRELKKLEV
jgi:hypothetical protein